MALSKITDADLEGKGVTPLDDIPGLSATEMKYKFEEIVRDIVIKKYNEAVNEVNGLEVIVSGNVANITNLTGRMNAAESSVTDLKNKVGSFVKLNATETTSIPSGETADVSRIEIYNSVENNEIDFDLCFNYGVAVSGSYCRVTAQVSAASGNFTSIEQDCFDDGKCVLNLRKHLVLEEVGNYEIRVAVYAYGGSVSINSSSLVNCGITGTNFTVGYANDRVIPAKKNFSNWTVSGEVSNVFADEVNTITFTNDENSNPSFEGSIETSFAAEDDKLYLVRFNACSPSGFTKGSGDEIVIVSGVNQMEINVSNSASDTMQTYECQIYADGTLDVTINLEQFINSDGVELKIGDFQIYELVEV